MGRPKTSPDDRRKRVTPVTWTSIAEKEGAQAYAKRMGRPLAAHLKYLLQRDMEANPAPPEKPAGGGSSSL